MKTPASLIAFTVGTIAAAPGIAAELNIEVEIPRLKPVEYHRPYVAVWLERADQSFAANLAVWYDVKMQNNKGYEWLKDMRAWWRKTGRELQLPIDGLSSATRAPGEHELVFNTAKAPLRELPAGDYRLVVEAAREVGGREMVAVPFKWPAAKTESAAGSHELGKITVNVKP